MASVFLSYAREDVAKAEALAAALERFGHSVWWDRQLEGGSRFSKEIEQALKGSDVVLVIWSRASLESGWVQDEAAEGRDSGRLVPVVIDESKPPLGFRQYQAIDLSAWKGRGNAAVIDAVNRAIVAKVRSPQPAEAPPKAPRRAFTYRRLGTAAAAILILALAALLYWLSVGPTAADHRTLRLQLAEFSTLSPDVPHSVPETLREELLTALATDAVIIATSEQRKAGSKSGFAVKASVRKAEDSLRFTVHLVDEKSGGTVWTETFDRPAAHIDIAPRQVAVGVSQVLRCGLTGAAHYGKPLRDQTLSLYFGYCGEHWAGTLGKKANPTHAMDLARRLTEAAPDFSPGWSALAQALVWATSASNLVDSKSAKAEAAAAAKRALKFDRKNSEAYQVLAALQPPFAHSAAEELHVKSVSVRPTDCGCEYVAYGYFLTQVGRNVDAVEALKRAHDMVPLGVSTNAGLAEALFAAGRPDDARRIAADMLKVWPQSEQIREALVRNAFADGHYDEALKILADSTEPLVSEQQRRAFTTVLLAMKSGSPAAKASAVQTLKALPDDSSVSRPILISAFASLGAHGEALSVAERYAKKEGGWALFVVFERPFAAIRRTPQFAQFAQQVGLSKYWRETRHLPDFCKEASPPSLCARL